MSSGRKTYDGNLAGRGFVDTERRDSYGNQVKTRKHASSERTGRVLQQLEEENFFEDEGEKDRYLITYADLITLLLGLFIILYAMSTIDVQKYEKMISAMGSIFGSKGEIVGIEGAGMNGTKDVLKANTLGEQLQEVIDVNGYGDAVQLIDNERGITIRILDNILFESGQAELGESSKTVLSKLADIMRDLPNDIRIEGHTDNVPIKTADYPSNWHLSVARATSTAYYLMNQEGMSEDKVSIVGYSEYNPVASNETPEGRALNRRVDIVILKNKK